jgi:Sulfocyanin (SoxE) domain
MTRYPFRGDAEIWGALIILVGIPASLAALQTPPAGGEPELPAWLSPVPANQTVELTLRVTPAAEPGSGLLNDHAGGDIQVVVPLGWTVRWTWHNADSTENHSLVVMVEREKLPTEGGRPAFTNAMTRMVTGGLKPGQEDVTTFEVDEAGWFWIMCGVPGHALKGEWIGLRVDPTAKNVAVKSKSQ